MDSPFDQKFLDQQRKKLLQLKTKLSYELRYGEIEERAVSPDEIIEEADWARVEQTRELSYTIKSRKIKQLQEIEYTLLKFENGTYGICEESGEPIEMKRLIGQPWARYSLHYAELAEQEAQKAA